jgi:hypothetical protein
LAKRRKGANSIRRGGQISQVNAAKYLLKVFESSSGLSGGLFYLKSLLLAIGNGQVQGTAVKALKQTPSYAKASLGKQKNYYKH